MFVRKARRWKSTSETVKRFLTRKKVEKLLGHPLPFDAIVLRIKSYIIVCPNQGYTNMLRRRLNAFQRTGHGGWLRCEECKEYDNPKKMYISPKGRSFHRQCRNKSQNERRRRAWQKILLDVVNQTKHCHSTSLP